ncbi:NADPH-dependent FMN reductase [Nocardia sp. NPDC004068]|uniref:NADPH-dependent FMN reductase n=1 Tax=Nocardia sp. NPDC004068 TaxID=3364303 RepID=UPI00368954A0
MSSSPLRLAIIVASVREGRFGPVVARWFAERARRHAGFEVTVIDLAEATLPLALPATSPKVDPDPVRPADMAALTEGLTVADAVVVVTPDINRSYPASLKTAIDWHYTQWDRKPIAFVGYGGLTGGLYAISHLREIFNELNAHTLRDYVSFPRYYELFDPEGNLHAPAGPEDAATTMLDQLEWWARALSTARQTVA